MDNEMKVSDVQVKILLYLERKPLNLEPDEAECKEKFGVSKQEASVELADLIKNSYVISITGGDAEAVWRGTNLTYKGDIVVSRYKDD